MFCKGRDPCLGVSHHSRVVLGMSLHFSLGLIFLLQYKQQHLYHRVVMRTKVIIMCEALRAVLGTCVPLLAFWVNLIQPCLFV